MVKMRRDKGFLVVVLVILLGALTSAAPLQPGQAGFSVDAITVAEADDVITVQIAAFPTVGGDVAQEQFTRVGLKFHYNDLTYVEDSLELGSPLDVGWTPVDQVIGSNKNGVMVLISRVIPGQGMAIAGAGANGQSKVLFSLQFRAEAEASFYLSNFLVRNSQRSNGISTIIHDRDNPVTVTLEGGEGQCTGEEPENAQICPDDSKNVEGNVAKTVVDACSAPDGRKCEFLCNADFGNCNDQVGDGCEVDISSNANNCGVCGIICPSGSCAGGECIYPTISISRAQASVVEPQKFQVSFESTHTFADSPNGNHLLLYVDGVAYTAVGTDGMDDNKFYLNDDHLRQDGDDKRLFVAGIPRDGQPHTIKIELRNGAGGHVGENNAPVFAETVVTVPVGPSIQITSLEDDVEIDALEGLIVEFEVQNWVIGDPDDPPVNPPVQGYVLFSQELPNRRTKDNLYNLDRLHGISWDDPGVYTIRVRLKDLDGAYLSDDMADPENHEIRVTVRCDNEADNPADGCTQCGEEAACVGGLLCIGGACGSALVENDNCELVDVPDPSNVEVLGACPDGLVCRYADAAAKSGQNDVAVKQCLPPQPVDEFCVAHAACESGTCDVLNKICQTECTDTLDNDADGTKDAEDPGCWTNGVFDRSLNDESLATTQCQDGIDNDGDNAIDFALDPHCASAQDNREEEEVACSQIGQTGCNLASGDGSLLCNTATPTSTCLSAACDSVFDQVRRTQGAMVQGVGMQFVCPPGFDKMGLTFCLPTETAEQVKADFLTSCMGVSNYCDFKKQATATECAEDEGHCVSKNQCQGDFGCKDNDGSYDASIKVCGPCTNSADCGGARCEDGVCTADPGELGGICEGDGSCGTNQNGLQLFCMEEDSTPPVLECRLPGDMNGDGVINAADFAVGMIEKLVDYVTDLISDGSLDEVNTFVLGMYNQWEESATGGST